MSALESTLHDDLTTALKARDELTLATLRMALSAVSNEKVAGKTARELTDDDVIAVLGREAKKRREAATAYTDAGRPELADREIAEEKVLARYLPAPLEDAELSAIVRAAISDSGATAPNQMGLVMKLVVPQTTGRADGARVSAEVRSQLAG